MRLILSHNNGGTSLMNMKRKKEESTCKSLYFQCTISGKKVEILKTNTSVSKLKFRALVHCPMFFVLIIGCHETYCTICLQIITMATTFVTNTSTI